MLRQYSQPTLREYGRVGALTLGDGGDLPDFNFPEFQRINNNCDAEGIEVACIVLDSGQTNPF